MKCNGSERPSRPTMNAGGVWKIRPSRASSTTELRVKSRFDLLSPRHERRILAVFHSSSAVGIVLTLLALGTITSSGPGRDGGVPVRGSLFELEVGKDAGLPTDAVSSTTLAALHEQGLNAAGTVESGRVPDNASQPIGY